MIVSRRRESGSLLAIARLYRAERSSMYLASFSVSDASNGLSSKLQRGNNVNVAEMTMPHGSIDPPGEQY
jgi:hypothetical protein